MTDQAFASPKYLVETDWLAQHLDDPSACVAVEQLLGPKDLILNPPGRVHSFRNDGIEPVQFMMVVGTSDREDVGFRAAA